MSGQSPLQPPPPFETDCEKDFTSWYNVIDSIVDFVGASSHLITTLRHSQDDIHKSCEINPKKVQTTKSNNDDIKNESPSSAAATALQHQFVSEMAPLVSYQVVDSSLAEPNMVPRSFMIIDTKDTGDNNNKNNSDHNVETTSSKIENEIVVEEEIECNHYSKENIGRTSNDSCYFNEYTDSDQTIDSLNLQETFEGCSTSKCHKNDDETVINKQNEQSINLIDQRTSSKSGLLLSSGQVSRKSSIPKPVDGIIMEQNQATVEKVSSMLNQSSISRHKNSTHHTRSDFSGSKISTGQISKQSTINSNQIEAHRINAKSNSFGLVDDPRTTALRSDERSGIKDSAATEQITNIVDPSSIVSLTKQNSSGVVPKFESKKQLINKDKKFYRKLVCETCPSEIQNTINSSNITTLTVETYNASTSSIIKSVKRKQTVDSSKTTPATTSALLLNASDSHNHSSENVKKMETSTNKKESIKTSPDRVLRTRALTAKTETSIRKAEERMRSAQVKRASMRNDIFEKRKKSADEKLIMKIQATDINNNNNKYLPKKLLPSGHDKLIAVKNSVKPKTSQSKSLMVTEKNKQPSKTLISKIPIIHHETTLKLAAAENCKKAAKLLKKAEDSFLDAATKLQRKKVEK